MDSNANEPMGRTLVLCFDGTAGQFDGDNTNVVKIFSLLKKDEPEKQLVYYQPGIGTFAKPGILTPAFLWLAKMVDMAAACYLDEHVLGGYTFLMQNYHPGDKIVMFGFSRGAYTCRALAGMIHKVGLLPRDNTHHAPFAYTMYKSGSLARAAEFKRAFARDVEITFVGLWDTVASVGLVRPRRLPFTSSNATVRTFRHALALDERRARFRPTLWAHATPSADDPPPLSKGRVQPPTSSKLKVPHPHPASAPVSAMPSPVPPSLHIISESESIIMTSHEGGRSPMRPPHIPLPDVLPDPVLESPVEHVSSPEKAPIRSEKTGRLSFTKISSALRLGRRSRRETLPVEKELKLERAFDEISTHSGRQTDVLEVWFAGNHSDVGGGNIQDSEAHMLSNVPLHWMVREAVLAQTGLLFDRAALARHGMQLGAFALASPPRAPVGLGLCPSTSPALSRSVSHEEGAEAHPHSVASALRPPRAPTSSSLQLNVYGTDSLSPLRDELKASGIWWGMELLPYEYWFQDAAYTWCRTKWPNMGKPRVIPGTQTPGGAPFVHLSVRQRMETPELAYVPRAQWIGEPNWVL